MKKFNSPTDPSVRLAARAAVHALSRFTPHLFATHAPRRFNLALRFHVIALRFSIIALLLGSLAPLATRVEAKLQTRASKSHHLRQAKSRQSRRRRTQSARTKTHDARQRAESVEREGRARLHEPTAGEEGEGDVARREEWMRLQRSYPFDTPPSDARHEAWASRPQGHLKNVEARGILSASAAQWTPIGPAPSTPELESHWGKTSGRINAIAVKPNDPNVVIVGASTGGIWRSTDGGTSFTPVSDAQVDLAVGSITFAPSNPNIVYAGMGDLWGGYLGTGILKSSDGGATWQHINDTSLPAFGQVNNVRVDPNDANRVYATVYQYYDGNPNGDFTLGGFFVSTNGGVTWQETLAGLARDVAIHPTNPQTLYVGMRRVLSNVDGVNLPGLYKSVDGGLTWARVYTSTFGAYTATTRIDMRVAVTPAAPQKVYLFSGNTLADASPLVFAVSDNEGQTWTTRAPTTIDPGQLFYNVYLVADPVNAGTLYLATRDVYKSTNDGASWQSLTKNFYQSGANWLYSPDASPPFPGGATSHPDQHSFAFSPANSSTFYIGNDGGISKTTNGGASFQSLNASLALSQFIGIAAHPTDPSFTVGGTQDNGSQVRRPGNGWTEFVSGDGGHPVINPVDPRAVLTTYVYGTLLRWRFDPNGAIVFRNETSNATFGEPSDKARIGFYAPFTGNGVDQTVYFGTYRLWISQNFADTVNTSTPTWLPSSGTFDQTKGGDDVLSAIGVAHTPYSNSQVIYTGSAQGCVKVSTDGGASWTPSDSTCLAGLPNRFVESITVDPSNAAIAYVTVGGFGSGHVFKTTNTGQSWTDLSGTNPATKLPNVSVTTLLIDPASPGVLYAGTDIGVFRSLGDGNWETFNNGLPPVPITSFAVNASGKIQVGTYGRGAFELTATTQTPTIQFATPSLTTSEASGAAQLLITRSGDTTSASTVDVRTLDDTRPVRCDDTTTAPATAFARCDYATTVQTITFAPHETQKSVAVPLINDAYVEPDESLQLSLSNPAGATLGTPSTMTLVITSDDAAGAANPIFNTTFFVRQQYLDFLSRDPEAGEPWSATLNHCAPNDATCDRISVSANFFRSQEFQLKGFFVFDFYRVAFARLPLYSEIIPDMSSLTATTTVEVNAKKAAFTNAFVQRQEFKNTFDAMDNQTFVNTLMNRYSLQSITTLNPATPDDTAAARVSLTRADLVNRLNQQSLTRAQVVRAIADSSEVGEAEFNTAFVAMQYFGYLRRDPDTQGFNDWLHTINANPADVRSMVNGFMNSQEYRLRFGTP